MTSPGGMEVGRISIRVVPDTSKFRRQAERELKAIAKELSIDIKVGLDTARAQAELKKLQSQADGKNVNLDVKTNDTGVVRQVRRLRQIAQKVTGAIRLSVEVNVIQSLVQIRKDLAIIKKAVKAYNISIPIEFVGISKWLAILSAVSGILLAIPHLIGAIGGAVSVVGGLFATLPALITGAGVAIGTLVVGMKGFFAALSASGNTAEFEKALQSLTPSAREAAKALVEFKQPLSDIRQAVQESLFQNMAEPLKQLKTLLPAVKSGMVGTAGGIREMVKEWIKMATSQQSVADLGLITGNVAKGFENAKTALAGFAAGLRDIAAVGSTFLPGFGTSISNIAEKFKDWAANARATGEMQQWIANALSKMKQLGRVLDNVWVAFRQIFESLRGGEDFLTMMERLTNSFRNFTALDSTQKSLQSLARVMRVVIDAAGELFGQVFKSAGEVLRALEPFIVTFVQTFGTVFADALRAITPLLKSMATWLSQNKDIMVPLAITVVAFVTAFKGLATGAKLVNNVYQSFKTMKSAVKIIGEVSTSLFNLVKDMAVAAAKAAVESAKLIASWVKMGAAAVKQAAISSAAWISSAIKSASFTARYYGIMVANAIKNWVRMAASAIANATKIAAVWIAQVIRMVAVQIAQMAIAVAAWVANWIRMAAVALAQAARIALAWLIAMGPIALVIAAVIALVVLIVLNWDKIASFLQGIWTWIKNTAASIWNAIVAFFTMIWNWMRDTAISTWQGIANFFTGIWNGISSVAQSVWNSIMSFLSGIWNSIRSVAETIINAIKDAWNSAIDWIKGIPGKIAGAISAGANVLFNIGKDIINGIVNGLKSAASAIWNFIKKICNDVWNSIKSFFGIASPSKLMAQGGEWIIQGLVIGMQKQTSDVLNTTASISQGIVDSFGNAMNIGQSIADGVMAGIPDAVKAVDTFTKTSLDQAQANFNANLGMDNVIPMGQQIAGALQGVTVEMDSRPVGRLIAKDRVMQNRRG